ncbi:MAG TPA: thioredoxin family protein [Bacteroidales bacterium]|nr:thioredoxin family protein [Bacteroidales bacterium]
MKRLLFFTVVTFLLSSVSSNANPYKVGDYASDFSLKDVNGKIISLSQHKDAKGFIVVFMCNTCPVVKKYRQRIIDLNTEYSGKGYPVVAINSNDSKVSPGDSYEDMKALAKSLDFKFDYLYDKTQNVAHAFGATNTPHVYVLAKKGDKFKVEYAGAIDNNADDAAMADKHYVQDAVNALLNNQKVPVPGTKAIGCGIKWKKD